MKVLVAGGRGFLGSAIVDALLGDGHEVGVLSRSSGKGGGKVEVVQGDVTEPAGLAGALAGWEVVVDAVQFPNSPIENPKKGYTFENVDLNGTKNLVDAAKAAGTRHFVDMSGVGAAADGKFHWLRFKWQAEQHIIGSGVPYTIIRPSWVYGPGDVSLNRFLGFAKFLPFVPVIGNGKTRINPVFVKDIGAHVAKAVELGPQGRIFEIGGPETLTMDEIVRTALNVQGKKRFLLHQPVWLMKIVASVVQFAPGRPLTPDAIDFITQDGVADTSALREVFGLRLTPLQEGTASYLGKS